METLIFIAKLICWVLIFLSVGVCTFFLTDEEDFDDDLNDYFND